MNNLDIIKDEINKLIDSIVYDEIKLIAKKLVKYKRIFIFGEGRSGIIGKSFSMRLAQLGLKVYFITESTTPAISSNDIVLLISGSGESQYIRYIINKINLIKATLVSVSSNESSYLVKNSTQSIIIPVNTKNINQPEIKIETAQPLSSLFDQGSHLVLDSVIMELQNILKIDNETMKKIHSNI